MKFIVKSIVTICIRVATTRSKLDHIKSTVTSVATSDNRVAIIRAENNLSTNKPAQFSTWALEEEQQTLYIINN
jgi:hypothetical protein